MTLVSTVQEKLSERPAFFATLFGALTLLAAFISQYGFGLHPCEMCWWQRYPYMVAIALFLVFSLLKQQNSRSLLALLALTFAVNAGIAAFHVGVEEKWWEGITTCASSGIYTGSTEDILKAIQNAPLIRCDEIQFSLFGISMAGYNFLISLFLTVFCAIFALRSRSL